MVKIKSERTIRELVSGAKEIFENAGGPVFVADLKTGDIIECNPQSERLIGRTHDEIVNMNQSNLFSRDEIDKYRGKISHIEKGSIVNFESQIQHKNGKIIPVSINVEVFSLHDKDLIIGFYTDVNPRKKQKEKIKKFYKDINKAKTEFISITSHHMRAPISTINWYSEMLLSGSAGKLKDDQKKYFKVVYDSSQKMIRLINGLLNTSTIELGTLAITPVPTDLTKSADVVLTQLKSQIDEKKLKVLKDYQPGLPLVPVDPDGIKLIFRNLLSNAIKYTPVNGIVRLDISKNNQNIIIKVIDTGYGIPKNQQSKIFTKLFRADNIRDKDSDGIGLGLYIIVSILNLTGGKIEFESTENKGSTFMVTLPLSGMKKRIGIKNLN